MNPICQTCPKRVGRLCTSVKPAAGIVSLRSCPDKKWGSDPVTIAPLRDRSIHWLDRCRGSLPWKDKPVSVILPMLEYNVTLDLVLEGIRRQTIPSVIYIIDTGSVETTNRIAALRDKNTEVIQLRMQGWWHTSMPVAAALDAAWGIINTPYAFFTHDDCFLKKQTCLEELVELCSTHHAVGHQITKREDPNWETNFGHTMFMLDVPWADRLGLSWNMRRFEAITGVSVDPLKCKMGYPDTETMMNHVFREAGFVPSFSPETGRPLFTGREANFTRNVDDWLDHCRSMTCAFYDAVYYKTCLDWARSAMADAVERYKTWA